MTRPRASNRLILPVWHDRISPLTSPAPYNAQETLVRKARAEAEAAQVRLTPESYPQNFKPQTLNPKP